jgi:streptogramin lyase
VLRQVTLWFTEQSANAIGRITASGKAAQFPLSAGYAVGSGIAGGPDGALWFPASGGGRAGGRGTHRDRAGLQSVALATRGTVGRITGIHNHSEGEHGSNS